MSKSTPRKNIEPEPEPDLEEEELNFSEEEGTTIDGIYIPPPSKPALTFDPNGPRLIITKIVNNFFKSYAEEQVLGPFHKCFNAIVGPNGSGKSNVIDSMLFVFGYRASKIRSKKISFLLHNSDKYKNVQSATVAVHFAQIIDKSGDEYDIVPGSEFIVSRTVNRDNSSYYEIDNRKVHFKEVGVLLKKHGIDLDHNRFLILQGEVEQIAMMKCKAENANESGMLEYLEDIIGTSRYKKPLVLLQERVEVLNDQRNVKLNRLKIVEKELKELEGPMEEALKFLKTENKIVRSRNIIYQKQKALTEAELKAVEAESVEIKEVVKGFEERLNEVAQKITETKDALDVKTKKQQAEAKELEQVKDTFNAVNKKDIELQEMMVSINQNRKKTKKLIAEEQQKLAKLAKQPKISEEGIKECEDKLEQLQGKLDKLEDEKQKLLATFKSETGALQEQRDVLQNKQLGIKSTVLDAESAMSLAETKLALCLKNQKEEQEKSERLQNIITDYKKRITERKATVNELKTKLPDCEKALKEASEALVKINNEQDKLKRELHNNRIKLSESQNHMRNMNSRNKVVAVLLEQKRLGNRDGIYGRLGDLGGINNKYDVAVSTACRGLDTIVVDTVDTAEWCINYLKEHNVGRASFIALDKQETLRERSILREEIPEGGKRLYDLITVKDEKVKLAFYHYLRDTVVADDIEQGTRIAFNYGDKRYRVVTLKGELIELSGAMSGGGNTVIRGKMGQSAQEADPKALERLTELVKHSSERLEELFQQQNHYEEQVKTLTGQIRPMKLDLEKFTREIKALEEQLPGLNDQLKEQLAKAKNTVADPKEVANLEAEIKTKRAAYEQAAKILSDLQKQVDVLNKEIKDKTTGKMSILDNKIKETKKEMDKCQNEISRLKIAVKTAERNTKKGEDNIAEMEKDVADMERRLKEMSVEREKLENEGKDLLKRTEELAEAHETSKEDVKEIKLEIDKLTKMEMKIKTEKIDVDHRMKEVQGKLNEFKAALHGYEVQLKQLKLQDVPKEVVEPLVTLSSEELENVDLKQVRKELEAAENFIKAAKPNLGAIEEYQKNQDVFMSRSKELEEITDKRNEMRKLFDDLRNQRKEEFTKGFNIIRMKLKEMYQMITLGGDADFDMVDSYDPFSEGIQLNIRPPKKTWKKISDLSGGEKTLSSLALVFALHYYKPSPLYVMDEIDAALDFKNVSIVGNYIKERTKNAQFIIISLRENMFELCDNLIGIYKTHNCTKTITIDPRVYDEETNNN